MPDVRRRCRGTWLAACIVLVSGCTQGGLDPKGDEAVRILTVTGALAVGGAIVAVLVLALWGWGTYRPGASVDARPEHVADTRLQRRFVIGGGLVLPAVVVAAYFGVQIWSSVTESSGNTGEMVIEVTGHQYWWEVDYRGVADVPDFSTVNEIHIPADTAITMVLHSDDVIHSFWVPELAGKVDLVPGRENRFELSAAPPGTYAGYCAEYCGLQHTWMKFEVVAMDNEAFDSWARNQAAPAAEPSTELEARGREVFLEQSCVGCHTIRGVSETGDLGPDLTHLASRSEIGAGIRRLNESNLTPWVVNAQAIKPGARMPPQELEPEELEALVTYLLSLE